MDAAKINLKLIYLLRTMMDPAMMAQMGGQLPQLPGNVGLAIDEYGRPFLVMRDQVSFLLIN